MTPAPPLRNLRKPQGSRTPSQRTLGQI